MIKRGLLIAARNLGDAVITSGFVSRLASVPNVAWTVWCRPDVAFLFEGQPGVEAVQCNRFPMGTNKNFTVRESARLLKTLARFRAKKFDVSLDLVGDFREVGLARLVGSRRHYSPIWPDDHSFRQLIRPSPSSWIPVPYRISPSTKSIYEVCDLIVSKVVRDFGIEPISKAAIAAKSSMAGRRLRVGLHPFASQEWRLWQPDDWRALASSLMRLNYEVIALGAPHERERLREIFREVLPERALSSAPLREFFDQVLDLDVLVGLDSLSVHVAHRVGRPSVMLIGTNDPAVWVPPSCTPVTSVARCGNQPCFNRPSCLKTEFEFDCMKQILVGPVLDAIHKCLSATDASRNEAC